MTWFAIVILSVFPIGSDRLLHTDIRAIGAYDSQGSCELAVAVLQGAMPQGQMVVCVPYERPNTKEDAR